jgi:hypothetical protein
MTRTFAALSMAAVMLGTPSHAGAQPPAPAAPQPPASSPQTPALALVDERSAQDVRQRLNELLRDHPPSLAQVLRLDPSLLTREGYLDPYPTLAAFIVQHPDIVRHPAFYLGSPNNFDGLEDPRSRAIRGVVDMTSYVALLGGFIGFFLLVGWLARLVVEHRRWLRATRTQTDAHSKLLERLTNNEDLLAYIQTPSARHFLESAPIPLDAGPRPVGAPVNRILWSVQAGVVLSVVGVGLWLATNSLIEELSGPLIVVSVLTIALGAGFALSAGVAYILSVRFGLLEPPKP